MLEQGRINFISFEFYYVSNDNPKNSGGRLDKIHKLLQPLGYRPVSFYTDWFLPMHELCVYNALYMYWPKNI